MQMFIRGVYAAGIYPSPSATGYMSLVFFNNHGPPYHRPTLLPAHLSASLRSVLKPRVGLGTRPHGLLIGFGCLGMCVCVCVCVRDPACTDARL